VRAKARHGNEGERGIIRREMTETRGSDRGEGENGESGKKVKTRWRNRAVGGAWRRGEGDARVGGRKREERGRGGSGDGQSIR